MAWMYHSLAIHLLKDILFVYSFGLLQINIHVQDKKARSFDHMLELVWGGKAVPPNKGRGTG